MSRHPLLQPRNRFVDNINRKRHIRRGDASSRTTDHPDPEKGAVR